MREWLKKIREEKGLSQKAVADLVGISQQYYNFIENGNRCEPDKNDTEKKIAEILGFEWTRFFEEENQETGVN